jgi:citrate/tricarballylate utilization protein
MFELDLTAEADRQFAVCNACRYCEGFCAVFGAVELRSAIGDGDVAYLANLCHDCRMCFDACMFTPPHEFAVNIPALMAQARVQTYERYSWPPSLARMFRVPGLGVASITLTGIVIVALLIAFGVGVTALGTAQLGAGAFYRVVPYLAMVVPALVLGVFGVFVLAYGARRYAHDIRSGDGDDFVSWRSVRTAVREAITLVYLQGGGEGCYDVKRDSPWRRFFHMLVFWGVLADFGATLSAAAAQELLGQLPPYPLWSVPVVLGTLGGVAIVLGAAGLIALKGRSDAKPTSARMIAMDYAFLAMLETVALTGLALLAFRSTAAMGSLLAIHLGSLAGLFITAPYGKFVHFVYRSIALVKNASERQTE